MSACLDSAAKTMQSRARPIQVRQAGCLRSQVSFNHF